MVSVNGTDVNVNTGSTVSYPTGTAALPDSNDQLPVAGTVSDLATTVVAPLIPLESVQTMDSAIVPPPVLPVLGYIYACN
jgi:hypothetical protein